VERKTIPIMKACELVGVSRRTIYNWMAAGKVQYVRTAGGAVRIFEDSLWRAPEGVLHRQRAAHVLGLLERGRRDGRHAATTQEVPDLPVPHRHRAELGGDDEDRPLDRPQCLELPVGYAAQVGDDDRARLRRDRGRDGRGRQPFDE